MSTQARRALIVVDVQNEYVTGNLPIEYPDIQRSLTNIALAMDAAKQAGLPIVVIQNTAPANAPIFAKGSLGWQLHDVVARRQWTHYVEKSLPSAFADTDLQAWLTTHGIDTLTVVGYMTHNCVDSTIKQAVHMGLKAQFLADAGGSVPYENRAGKQTAEQIHRAFSVVLQSRFAAVMSTAEWIAAIRRNDAPERDSIFQSNQRARNA